MKPPAIWTNLSELIQKLPGIGIGMSRKLSMHLLNNRQMLRSMIDTMESMYNSIGMCSECRNFTKYQLCDICSSTKRDRSKLCITASHSDLYTIELTGAYNGLYYVLGDDFRPTSQLAAEYIDKIRNIIRNHNIGEVILAFNPSVEGSILISYIKLMLGDLPDLNATHLGLGMPMNSSIDSVGIDSVFMALQNRKKVVD